MSLLEHEQRRSQRKHAQQQRRRERQQQVALDMPAPALHDDAVLLFHEWCALNTLSERNGRRILAGPDGPTVTQLSARRFGITVRNNRLWQQTRERA